MPVIKSSVVQLIAKIRICLTRANMEKVSYHTIWLIMVNVTMTSQNPLPIRNTNETHLQSFHRTSIKTNTISPRHIQLQNRWHFRCPLYSNLRPYSLRCYYERSKDTSIGDSTGWGSGYFRRWSAFNSWGAVRGKVGWSIGCPYLLLFWPRVRHSFIFGFRNEESLTFVLTVKVTWLSRFTSTKSSAVSM